MPQRGLYQDRFLILSTGPYSNVAAREVGLSDSRWRETSTAIRLEHECTHYFTLRVFGSMRNNLLDELIADFMGITAADGRYRSDWFLRLREGTRDERLFARSGAADVAGDCFEQPGEPAAE